MKKLTAVFIIIIMMTAGCAGLSINPDADGITMLQKSAVSTIGYLVADSKQEYIPDLLKWYAVFNSTDDFIDVQQVFKAGTDRLMALLDDHPYLQLQIRNAMDMLNISINGPVIPADLSKYRKVVDLFMSGVNAVQVTTTGWHIKTGPRVERA